ncbi:PTS sugar transporter subunit IIA [Fonticella tunisiensis]|uniref:PTS system IIA component (Fru family) n=1 Tax=Fonticella tunisiensis TaxID=1096341 RepID=A0A4R7KU29_9CLOT|nr:PTS sugar transporter subunit IIA [Fonticella tunisiensis]TDT62750.1 PTS system IIA component (Fru family) [Fonticella tunisiensis]
MDIKNLININLIKAEIKATRKEEVIKELAELLDQNNKLNSLEVYLHDVFKREEEYTTGIGRGIAIPHGKSEGVKESCIAIGKCNDVEWDSMDGNPVKIVILIAVPLSGAQNEHLMILAKLAELLMDEEFTQNLVNSKNPEDIYRLLTGQEELAS